jgi:hypothetical protein
MRRALTTPELRVAKLTRDEFLARPRIPITVVFDGVRQNYNIGAIFRLCDTFLVQELVVCGAKVELHNADWCKRRKALSTGCPGATACRPAKLSPMRKPEALGS